MKRQKVEFRVKRFSPASKSTELASKGIAQASKDLDGPAGLGLDCGDVEYFVDGHAWLDVVWPALTGSG